MAKKSVSYAGDKLNRIAFPLGGMGAGTICIEGTGALSHVSLHHNPDIHNEPMIFAGLSVKAPGRERIARVLEGPVPEWKYFGQANAGEGLKFRSYGLPRFCMCSVGAQFPFASIELSDAKLPTKATVLAWSPFTPGNSDDSSLPVAALEYRFKNTSKIPVQAVFSYNSANFMEIEQANGGYAVTSIRNGLVLSQKASKRAPAANGAFAIQCDDPRTKVNCAWFRGGWFDPRTMAWTNVEQGVCVAASPVSQDRPSPGGSIYVPFTLGPGKEKRIIVRMCWYVPKSDQRWPEEKDSLETYVPWYAGKFPNIAAVATYWEKNYSRLREASLQFSDCLFSSTLPTEIVDAVSSNLSILKSPTVLRQKDGRFWAWEGCEDSKGSCAGSCTHVWNYAQALPHLFPDLERTMRETEFFESQNKTGYQAFRAALPIGPRKQDFHAAADGQLGGIIKVYREWRISGDHAWLKKMWPAVRKSLEYCIKTWDPDHEGIFKEPHHNTYDIEFWGPNGMCTSFYLGALCAAAAMGTALDENIALYETLAQKSKRHIETQLFNGEYFFQKVTWKGLRTKDPTKLQTFSWNIEYSSEAIALLKKEGPKYQYGTGCLSDGVIGAWMAEVCGLGILMDRKKVVSHLKAVHKYNFKKDLSAHANPQRPGYALGKEGGLLLCTWPKGGKPSLPFVYSDEVWTGIEYQVASHLIMNGEVKKGLDIVAACRARYNGRVRNPFNEYECGHWYARALASYALLQAYSGIRYDAVDKVLFMKPVIQGDFQCFFSTATGYGLAGVKKGKAFVDVKSGVIKIKEIKCRGVIHR